MNSRDDSEYRLNLAKGFLKEAEEDFKSKRWRSCVACSQLVVENAGKAILVLFGVSPKTHEPAKQLAKIFRNSSVPSEIRNKIKEVLPDFLTLGVEEHFMTDYGDESSYTLPWDMFDEASAKSALDAARLCMYSSQDIVNLVHKWRSE